MFLAVLGCFLSYSTVAQVEFVGEPEDISDLNTPDGENYLVLSPHDKQMAFTKERNRGDDITSNFGDTFSQVFDSTWQATVYSDWTNEKGMFSPIGFDKDGNQFFSEVSFYKGVYKGKVLKFLIDGGAAEVEIPFLKNKSSHQSGCLSKDGMFMILSIESNYSFGVEDLYVVRKMPGGAWASPINLGENLNTEFQELTPFLASDNRTLYFSTNGRGGAGSFDIFYSKRLDDSWRKWSTPVNLGEPVNSPGAETSFSYTDSDTWAYYVTSQNSDGYGDIKRVKIKPPEFDSLQTESTIPLTDPKEITIKIIDKASNEVTPAIMIVGDVSIPVPKGLFVVDSAFLSNGEVEIKANGYLPKILQLDSNLRIGINEVPLESLKIGNVITLKNVLFYRGSPIMLDDSKKELDLVVEMMNDNPTMKILLKGHTDNQGDPVLNRKLSEERVKSVRKYLVRQGISAYRMKGIGYGGNAPIASNDSEETRRLNRRVEFEVIDN